MLFRSQQFELLYYYYYNYYSINMPEIVEKAKETVANAWDATKNAAESAKEAVVGKPDASDRAENAWDKTKDKARDLKNDLHEKKGEVKEKMND